MLRKLRPRSIYDVTRLPHALVLGVAITWVFAFALTPVGEAATQGIGGLIPRGCFQNTGGLACGGIGGTRTAAGLAGATGVAVSGDGKSVYVASASSNAIATFARNPTSGELTPVGCIQNTGGTDCNGVGGTAAGLSGATGVAVSGDGKDVYVASRVSSAIAVFARNPTTGGLTPVGCIQNTGGTDCNAAGTTAPGLSGATGVAVSGDGKSVYVASYGSDAIAAFTRNPTTGGLTAGGCVQNTGETDCDGIGGTAAGLGSPWGVAVSGDGKDLYVASFNSDAIAVFARDTTTGGLTTGGCIQNTGGSACKDRGGNAAGLAGPEGVAVSRDGNDVYVASYGSSAIAAFARNPTTGGLTRGGCVQTTGGSTCTGAGGNAPGLNGAAAVALSGDGKSVYAAAFKSSAIAVFGRDPTSGGLTPGGCIEDASESACGGAGRIASGLGEASGVAVSGDGKSVYVASYGSGAIVQFERAARPPVVAIARPANGGHYRKGARVRASYSCFDPNGSAGVASCHGPVATGQPIATATLGKHAFKVTAIDMAGNRTSKTVSYTVVVPPAKPKITKTINAAKQRARFSFSATRARRYQCALVKAKPGKKQAPKPRFSTCKSPKTYKQLKPGHYTFEVRGVSFGIAGPAAKVKFKV